MNRGYIDHLNKISENLLNSLYGKLYQPVDECRNEAVPSFKTKYFAQIGLRNIDFQCMIILGIGQEVCNDLLSEILEFGKDDYEKEELMKSALGELANTIACEVMSNEEMIKEYGKLFPTPPLVWMTDGKIPDFIPSDGMSSHLANDKRKFYTHIAALRLDGAKSPNNQNWNPTQSLSIYDPTVLK